MMNRLTHYMEFTLLPNADIPATELMNQLFARVHLAIIASRASIGVSFPQYSTGTECLGLGNCMRAFGSSQGLSDFRAHLSVRAMDGYIIISEPRAVPENCRHVRFMRRQSKGHPAATARFARRNTIDKSMTDSIYVTGAKKHIEGLPFVRYFSRSTQNRMMLFIARSEIQDQPVHGPFTGFGLSHQGTTVPEFG